MTAFSSGAYTSGISRNAGSPAGGEPLVPTPVSNQIIQELPTSSVALSRMKRVQMSSLTSRQPVLATLPNAYFVDGSSAGSDDYVLQKTTQQRWANVSLIAAEMAVDVPIPQAYLDDADVDIWSEVRPRIVEALGTLIDGAVLFGVNKPAVWSTDIATAATAAGNVIAMPSTISGANGPDLGATIAQAGRNLKKQGFSINGFATAPGFGWELAAFRNQQGNNIYQPNPDGTPGGNLYGFPTTEALNGGWVDTTASVIAGAWDNAIIGIRQDITFSLHTEGVIQDNSGAIVLNLMQQNVVNLRCVMRMGFATANPVTAVASSRGRSHYPFIIVGPESNLT